MSDTGPSGVPRVTTSETSGQVAAASRAAWPAPPSPTTTCPAPSPANAVEHPGQPGRLAEGAVGVTGRQRGHRARGERDEPLPGRGDGRVEALRRAVGEGEVDEPVGRYVGEGGCRVAGDAHPDDGRRLVVEQLVEVDDVGELAGRGLGHGDDVDAGRGGGGRHDPAVAAGPAGDQALEPAGEVTVPDQVGDVAGDQRLVGQGAGEHVGVEPAVARAPGHELVAGSDQCLVGAGVVAHLGAVRGEPDDQLGGVGTGGERQRERLVRRAEPVDEAVGARRCR